MNLIQNTFSVCAFEYKCIYVHGLQKACKSIVVNRCSFIFSKASFSKVLMLLLSQKCAYYVPTPEVDGASEVEGDTVFIWILIVLMLQRHFLLCTISFALWKHAFSNIQKISPSKTETFQKKKIWYFSYFCSKHRLWVLIRTAWVFCSKHIRKNNVYPCKSQFYNNKLGFKVVKIM